MSCCVKPPMRCPRSTVLRFCTATSAPASARDSELGLYMQKYCGCVFSEEDRYAKQISRDMQAPEKHL